MVYAITFMLKVSLLAGLCLSYFITSILSTLRSSSHDHHPSILLIHGLSSLINLSLTFFSERQGAFYHSMTLYYWLIAITHWVFGGVHGDKIYWKPHFHLHLLQLQECLLTLDLDTFLLHSSYHMHLCPCHFSWCTTNSKSEHHAHFWWLFHYCCTTEDAMLSNKIIISCLYEEHTIFHSTTMFWCLPW